MNISVRQAQLAMVLAISVPIASCAKVPPEVVSLSSGLGEDIVATQTSYQLLITGHFDNLRSQVNVFVDTRWRPVFLRGFIQKGNLVGRAKESDPEKVLSGVNNWVQVATETIDAKRKELLDPIDADEQALRVAVDEAFNRMIHANSTVTAHLNSIRKVTAFQDQILQAGGVKELRDKINQALIEASTRTQRGIDAVANADKVVTEIEDRLR